MQTAFITTLRSLFILAFLVVIMLLAIPYTATPLGEFIEVCLPSISESSSDVHLHRMEKPSREIEAASHETLSVAAQRPPVLSESLTQGRSKRIQDRLKLLGASYMAMERISESNPVYRFYCRMPLSGNSTYSRNFEESDSDPLRAMEQVLFEVERWRTAQARPPLSKGSP